VEADLNEESYATPIDQAELSTTAVTAHVARFSLDRPTNRVFYGRDRYWIDMCLTPRPEQARGCYHERWGPNRFERLGEIFLVPPREALHVRTHRQTADQLSIVCEIEAEAVERWLPAPMEWTDQRLAAALDINHWFIRSCLFRLAEEVRSEDVRSLKLAELLAQLLAIEVARFVEAVCEGPATGGLSPWRLRRIEERIHQHGPQPSLEELADICGLSVRQLTRGFRVSRGCSIGEHIGNVRIEIAKGLLGQVESVKEIAFALGFTSASSFSTAFRRATGSTPTQFRARQRHG
jgi:AraC family transcriptional regulator